MSSDKASSLPTSPVWCTGPEQIEVELVVTGEMYSVDVDIAKRMGIIQGNRDFERALTFCANDRSCSQPPSKELAHIIQETALPNIVPPSVSPEPKPAPEASASSVEKGFTDMALADDDDDDEDGSYVPSESEASDSGEEYSDTDLADVGTANIKAERDEHNAREKEKHLLGLQE
ncbi:hypothetical protein FRC11_015101 [Ceratobasidium sp. 423]|nr:hypothetical protein FRC11_015101 [Ceratobasidium sp. 423]